MDEWSSLGKEKVKNKSQTERIKIENERSDLFRALKASICYCPSCNQSERDMVYNAPLGEWYCTLCVQGYRDFYREQEAIYGDLKVDDNDFYETFL